MMVGLGLRRFLVKFAMMASLMDSKAQLAPPQFNDYPAGPVVSGKPATPLIRDSRAKRFRSKIREAAAAGAKFAGHFAVAQWGCGTSCDSMAIIDVITGQVERGPYDVLSYAPDYRYEGEGSWAEFQLDSRLMIIRGCPERKACGTYYFVWNSPRFSLVRFVPHG